MPACCRRAKIIKNDNILNTDAPDTAGRPLRERLRTAGLSVEQLRALIK